MCEKLNLFKLNPMINRTMANIDVKLGIKHILDRVEQAYLKRSPVREDMSLNQLMYAFVYH